VATAPATSADEQALRFRSDHYFLIVGGLRLRLRRWLDRGALADTGSAAVRPAAPPSPAPAASSPAG
jgi:hypothetical protein